MFGYIAKRVGVEIPTIFVASIAMYAAVAWDHNATITIDTPGDKSFTEGLSPEFQ